MNATKSTPSSRSGRGRRIPPLVLAGAALVGGLGVGRFLTYDGDDGGGGAGAAATASVASLDGQVAELEARVAVDADDVSAWQALGAAYVRRAAEVGDPAFYALAERAFDEADERVPGDQATLVGRGALALSLHRFDDALELGQRAVEANPASAAAIGVVVDAQVELGRYDEAAVTLQRLLDLRPDLRALARTSYLRELNGDLPGALAAMRRAEVAGAGAAFDLATVGVLLGDLRLKEGDLRGAEADFDRALEAVPGLVGAEVGRARVLAATERVDEAVVALEAVVARVPFPPAVLLLGELQERSGDAEAAADTFELVRAMSRLQEAAGQVVDLEMALFEADEGDPAAAVELARRAHAARPDNVFVNDALGWALFRAGDPEAAVVHVEQALRLGSLDPAVRFHAAATFEALGDDERAGDELERAIELTPLEAFAYRDEVLELAATLDVTLPE